MSTFPTGGRSRQPQGTSTGIPLAEGLPVPEDHESRILLHICCAPCATYPVEHLRRAGLAITGYWYNPNVQPWSEHERRRDSLVGYAAQAALPVVWEAGYDVIAFMRLLAGHEAQGDRCAICYRLRLARAAACARRLGISCFTTTLLISPFQDRALIRTAGESAAREQGVAFLFEDWRSGWPERGRLTRHYGLYQQHYCGCLYSEFERYTGIPVLAAQADNENR